MPNSAPHRGFTLIELTMVIVLLGVIGATVSVFVRGPVDAYFATARRAALSDEADTTLRRMTRDLRKALPNSVRTPSTTPPGQCLEFIPTKTGGRYRADVDDSGHGDTLEFTRADASFAMLGSNAASPLDQQISAGDVIAVYNLGIAGADAYHEDNTATVVALTGESGAPVETGISIVAKQFPLASASHRFHVVPADEKIVAYVCQGGALYRTTSTTFSSSCPANGAMLARHVSACEFDYSGSDLQRNALVRLMLTFSDQAETVSLLDEVHISNTP